MKIRGFYGSGRGEWGFLIGEKCFLKGKWYDVFYFWFRIRIIGD